MFKKKHPGDPVLYFYPEAKAKAPHQKDEMKNRPNKQYVENFSQGDWQFMVDDI